MDAEPDGKHKPPHERSPVDVLRLVVASTVLAVLVLVGIFGGNTLTGFLADLLDGLDALPTWMASVLVLTTRVLLLVVLVGGLVGAIKGRRTRVLVTVIAAGLLAAVIAALLSPLAHAQTAELVQVRDVLGPVSDEEFPPVELLAFTAGAAAAASPWLSRRWRELTWALVIAAALSEFVTAPVSLDTVYAVTAGWFAGSALLVAFGGPVRRPTDEAVVDGLLGVGVELAELKPAAVDARGSTPYFGTTTDGNGLFVKALGGDERSADLLFRAYRRILPHDLGDERSYSSLRRTVEHEALVAMAARQAGIRTPRFVAFASVEPNAYVLAYEAIAGDSLDRVDPDQLTSSVLAGLWEQVTELRHHRIAHRDLRLANVFLSTEGEIWLIDFGFSEIGASDLLLATDLAELLASTTLAVGPDRALAAARAAIAPDELATAAPRLRPFALSGATRAGMKEHSGVLDRLRGEMESASLSPGPA